MTTTVSTTTSHPQPTPPRRRAIVVAAALACLLGFLFGYATGPSRLATPQIETTQAEAAPAPAPAAPIADTFGDGTYVVGEDIAPGRYRAPGSDLGCYWARLSSLDGAHSIIANDAGSGPRVVTILATDAAFETTGCGTWVKS